MKGLLGGIPTIRSQPPSTSGLAGVIAVAALLLLPAASPAASLNGNDFSLQFTAAAGEANTLTIERAGAVYRFTDKAGITITPTGTCSAAANVGTCPVAQVSNIGAGLGDMNDTGTVAASIGSPVSSVNVAGGTGNDTLSSNGDTTNGVFLTGDEFGQPPGNDILVGGPGTESLGAGGGNDVMSGGDGDDFLSIEDGSDSLAGGPGRDAFTSGSDPDGPDAISGGPGDDRVDLRSRTDDLLINLNGVADDGAGCPGPGCEGDNYGADLEDFSLGRGNDTLIGSPGNEFIGGGEGNDLLQGMGGNDSLQGDSGDDRLEGGAGADFIITGNDADLASGGAGDDTFHGDFFDDDTDRFGGGGGFDSFDSDVETTRESLQISLNGRADDGFRTSLREVPDDNVLADIEDVVGGDGDDVLIGSRRPNQLSGLGGRDRLVGLGGQDALLGGRGRDLLAGGKSADLLDGAGGPDLLRARGGGSDELRCGSSLDRAKADRSDRFGPDCDKVSLPRRRH